jgi:hypothetical protein
MPTRLVRIPSLAAAAAAALVVGFLPAAPPAAAAVCGPASPCIRIGDATVHEGHSGARKITLDVTLSHPAARRLGIDYRTVDDTAKAPSDYVATSGTLIIERGETAKSLQVGVRGDQVAESNDTFFVDLTRVGFALSITSPYHPIVQDMRGTATILNDDGPVAPPTAPTCPPSLPNCQEP